MRLAIPLVALLFILGCKSSTPSHITLEEAEKKLEAAGYKLTEPKEQIAALVGASRANGYKVNGKDSIELWEFPLDTEQSRESYKAAERRCYTINGIAIFPKNETTEKMVQALK